MSASVEQMVRFREGRDVIIIIPAILPEEKDNMWYSRNELCQFEHDAMLEDLLAKKSKKATVDDLLAVRSKKLMEQMRKEMSDLRETWEQLNLNTLRSEVLEHKGMDGSNANDSTSKQNANPNQIEAEDFPHVGLSRDPPSPGYSPNSVCHDLSSARETPSSAHKPSIVNDSQCLPPLPIFGPSSASKGATHQAGDSYEVPLKRHPTRTRRRLPPPKLDHNHTLVSRRKSDSYLQSGSRHKTTSSTRGNAQKQTPGALLHRRKSGGSDNCRQVFKRSFTEPTVPIPSTTLANANTTTSTSTVSQISEIDIRDQRSWDTRGWSVPLGVHQVVCKSPGLLVTCDVHRRSAPVKRVNSTSKDGNCSNSGSVRGNARSRRQTAEANLIIPPGTYVEVVETQAHGDRVRGKIVWDVMIDDAEVAVEQTPTATRKRSSLMLGKLRGRKDKVVQQLPRVVSHRYSGWISLQWASNANKPEHNSSKYSDEDAGPWTKPVSLGVYRVTCENGLQVQGGSASPRVLEKGAYFEVIEAQVHGNDVRARCIFAPTVPGQKSLQGWTSLFNTITGSSVASSVPLGAYMASSSGRCLVTETSSIYSKVHGRLPKGSCVEIVATRLEDGLVRGLMSTGGHVTLITPDERHHLSVSRVRV